MPRAADFFQATSVTPLNANVMEKSIAAESQMMVPCIISDGKMPPIKYWQFHGPSIACSDWLADKVFINLEYEYFILNKLHLIHMVSPAP